MSFTQSQLDCDFLDKHGLFDSRFAELPARAQSMAKAMVHSHIDKLRSNCRMRRISQLGSRSDLILRICRDHIKNSKCGVGGGQEDSNDDKVFGGRSSNEM